MIHFFFVHFLMSLRKREQKSESTFKCRALWIYKYISLLFVMYALWIYKYILLLFVIQHYIFI